MTAPTSPGVVPADEIDRIAKLLNGPYLEVPEGYRWTLDELRETRWANTGPQERAVRRVEARAIMADRANRPSLTEDERASIEEACDHARMLAYNMVRILPNRPTQRHVVQWVSSLLALAARLRALADRSEPRQEKEGKA